MNYNLHSFLPGSYKKDGFIVQQARLLSTIPYNDNNNYIFKKPYIAETMVNEWRNDGNNYFYQKFWEERCELEYGQFLPTDIAFKEVQDFCMEYGKVISNEEKINYKGGPFIQC